jgi:RNA polymerase-binding transcription factor DksA
MRGGAIGWCELDRLRVNARPFLICLECGSALPSARLSPRWTDRSRDEVGR